MKYSSKDELEKNYPIGKVEIQLETKFPKQVIYNITDYVYSTKENSWYPVIDDLSDIFENLNNEILPYDVVLNMYKNYIITNTVEQ